MVDPIRRNWKAGKELSEDFLFSEASRCKTTSTESWLAPSFWRHLVASHNDEGVIGLGDGCGDESIDGRVIDLPKAVVFLPSRCCS
jgi:hypothetical protein